ncbi:MAG: DnaT-like ssDNA-binding domain-containing protein [Motiliproteus sp.]
MSSLFPEQPILFYPSLACRFGAEAAILLAVYHQYARHHGGLDERGSAQFVIRRHEWLELTPYWSEEQLAQLTNTLVEQGLVEAQFQANGSIRLSVLESVSIAAQPQENPSSDRSASVDESWDELVGVANVSAAVTAEVTVDIASEIKTAPAPQVTPSLEPAPTTTKPPRDAPNRYFEPTPSAATVAEPVASPIAYGHVSRGPAPSFGGSTGWAKPQDQLEQLFEQQEQHNRQLKTIQPGWQPQSTTLQMLTKQGMTEQFALDCVDQFVAYYMEQGQRKKSWEQPFLKWAKRDWVDAQKKQHRQQTGGQYSAASSTQKPNAQQGYQGERDQTHSRQDKRERITSAVMDIKNTDW